MDFQSLKNDLNNGFFEKNEMNLDTIRVIEALRILMEKTEFNEVHSSVQQSEFPLLVSRIENLESKLDDYEFIIKKMAKDYPEIVLAKPHLFKN